MQKYTAIILSSRDVGEFDRIYTFYTRELGFVRAVGRGVRKQTAKLAGHLEPGTLSEVYIAKARGMGNIASAIALDNFDNIKKDFEKLTEVLKIFRFFGRHFSEEEKDERVFDLLRDFLEKTNSAEEIYGADILLESFWWKFFDALGNRPETMKCAKCGARLEEKRENFFSAVRGGIVCGKCFSGEQSLAEISVDQIKLLRIFLANPLGNILKVKVDNGELGKLGRIRKDFERYNF
jgi:DNA repair protein RecO (recombination protein O)